MESNNHISTPKEIEKKYLILENGKDYSTADLNNIFGSSFKLREEALRRGIDIDQGYLDSISATLLNVRLDIHPDFAPDITRLRKYGKKFFLTIKSRGHIERNELEREIDSNLFNEFWYFTEGTRVQKKRHVVEYHGYKMEVDVFTDRDLVTAEIEFPSMEEAEKSPVPGMDISLDPKYKNSNMGK